MADADTADKAVDNTDRNPCPGGADILAGEQMINKQIIKILEYVRLMHGEKKAGKGD